MRPQSTQYGLPLFLEDASGLLVKTTFTDLHDRLQLVLKATSASGPNQLQLALSLSTSRNAKSSPDCIIDLPQRLERGTLSYGAGPALSIESYLRRVSGLSSRSPNRRFTASDSHNYTWSMTQSNPRDSSTISWVCTNSQGAVVAEYATNDPEVTGSRCAAVLTIEEAQNSMVLELLTTLTIVRYIAQTSS
ncbi:hypothetical protein FRB95_008949 [Tulasnella sp. JGI-2019a]|nr:hypothetical protein FRB93_008612 [Tulasnella sp. JGI-2019a]KAG9036408.1 hypothetical protein FRB95_008949 [Tulasnella sp. JGI-2019a]